MEFSALVLPILYSLFTLSPILREKQTGKKPKFRNKQYFLCHLWAQFHKFSAVGNVEYWLQTDIMRPVYHWEFKKEGGCTWTELKVWYYYSLKYSVPGNHII